MNILRNNFILPIFSLTLYISLILSAQAATLDDVKTYFEEIKSNYLQEGDTLTYSAFEEKENDRFLVKDIDLYLMETKRRFKYKQVEFTFSSDTPLLNSSLSNIIVNGHTLTVREGDDRTELNVDQINIEGVIKFLNDSLIVPEPTTITSTKISMRDFGNGFQADFNELKVVNIQRANKELLTVEEVNLSPVSGETKNKNETQPAKFSIDGITLKGVKSDKGILHSASNMDVGKISFDFSQKEQDISFVFDGLTATNASLNTAIYSEDPNAGDDIPLIPFDNTNYLIKPMDFKINGKSVVTTKEMVLENKKVDENQTYAQTFKINDIFVDLLAAPEPPKNIEQMKALGLEKLNMSMKIDSTWNLKSGEVDISKYLIDIKQMGEFDMGLKFSGVTEDIFRRIQKVQAQMLKIEDQEKRNQASMAMLTTLTGVTIDALSLKVTDKNFLDKAMLIATQSEEKAQQTKAIAGPMVGVLMAPYNLPELAQQITAAITTFMSGNKSIEVAANPETGLTIMEIIGLSAGVQSNTVPPADIIKRLNVSVKAE